MGTQHPVPENIPHLSSPTANNGGSLSGNGSLPGHGLGVGQSGSPVKEASFLHRETSVDDQDNDTNIDRKGLADKSVSPPVVKEGVPIRWQS